LQVPQRVTTFRMAKSGELWTNPMPQLAAAIFYAGFPAPAALEK